MEVAVIDWKTIDSRLVVDDLYEHINAPKWVDLAAPSHPVDDDAWFCRSGSDRVEHFSNEKQRTPIPNSKIQRSASVSECPNTIHNCRDATLKKRGGLSNKDKNYYEVVEDDENQDPNLSRMPKVGKRAIKSSAEAASEPTPKLRSTLSATARNLFPGADLLSKVSELCNELKKLATRAQDEKREKERKPLLEQRKQESEVSSSMGILGRKKRSENSDNTPVSVDVKNIQHLNAEGKSPIRTSPPTPQCLSAGYGNTKSRTPKPNLKTPPLNQERGILQELKQIKKDVTREEKKSSRHHGGGEVAEKEARSLDVFWFLKPCTLSS